MALSSDTAESQKGCRARGFGVCHQPARPRGVSHPGPPPAQSDFQLPPSPAEGSQPCAGVSAPAWQMAPCKT